MLKRQEVKGSDQIKVTFVIPNDPEQDRIYVVGDFNDWEAGANLLVKRSNNTRSASVVLDSGQRYAFRYCTEDGEWFNDDGADAYETNDIGTENCIIIT
jgi:1,4-alpha-glucan branching enzyme